MLRTACCVLRLRLDAAQRAASHREFILQFAAGISLLMTGRPKKPAALGEILADLLKRSGIADRVEQAGVIPEWPGLVGEQIASVTEPLSITPDGTLFVAVRTNAWMTELSLLEPELLRSLNGKPGRPPVSRIRWQIKR